VFTLSTRTAIDSVRSRRPDAIGQWQICCVDAGLLGNDCWTDVGCCSSTTSATAPGLPPSTIQVLIDDEALKGMFHTGDRVAGLLDDLCQPQTSCGEWA
jgi:hypothetical protein